MGRARGAVSVVDDQIGGPTAAGDIAATLLDMARQMAGGNAARGIYHYSGAPDVSWADFARAIFEITGLDVTVTDIPSSDYPLPAPRPANSRLDCATLERDFGITRPDWRQSLRRTLRELGEIT